MGILQAPPLKSYQGDILLFQREINTKTFILKKYSFKTFSFAIFVIVVFNQACTMIKIQEILDLSIDERLSMVEKIWDSIDQSDIPVPESHKQELDKRLKRFENGETTFYTWEEIKEELASRRLK